MMKASYMLPSGTYNLFLSKEDLIRLLEKGMVTIHTGHISCVTGRGVYDPEEHKIITHDKKEVYNDLRFMLTDSVADLKPGLCNVQFLNIHLEKEKENG